jgi:hypothetical protein
MLRLKDHSKRLHKLQESSKEFTQEHNVQNKLFGTNDYIPFTETHITESVEEHPDNHKKLIIKATHAEPNEAAGLVVPKHMWEGTVAHKVGTVTNKGVVREKDSTRVVGMNERNEARAKVYGKELRQPLTRPQITKLHTSVLEKHFSKSEPEQIAAEKEAIAKLKKAKHLDSGDTTDKGEKTDTVNVETDEQGRHFTAAGSKGVAGHAVYTAGSGDKQEHHIIITCKGQTKGCGGGVDAHGIADTSKGTCFAPNAENQYPNAAVRRATHEQAKHDPKMSADWILAHAHSLRNNANVADKQNKRFLFRPNIVDETDTTSRVAIKHLNKQRQEQGKPPIIGNGYGKMGELHDPENHWHVTYSNTGPKVKGGHGIKENADRDRRRISESVTASGSKGDYKNDEGHNVPPKGSYMVTDMKRGSALDKEYQTHITHAKYWSAGREEHQLTDHEKAQGHEGHYDGEGKPTTPENAHYGHKTVNGRRYDYQKQHILHPRLVDVPITAKGKTEHHLIPSDSRFLDEQHLPKERFKSKNGKNAGGILVTTPTTSTSDLGHQSSFTHHVDQSTIEHAKKHGGEHEIDAPEEQEKARTNGEYAAPTPISAKIPKISDLKKKKK